MNTIEKFKVFKDVTNTIINVGTIIINRQQKLEGQLHIPHDAYFSITPWENEITVEVSWWCGPSCEEVNTSFTNEQVLEILENSCLFLSNHKKIMDELEEKNRLSEIETIQQQIINTNNVINNNSEQLRKLQEKLSKLSGVNNETIFTCKSFC